MYGHNSGSGSGSRRQGFQSNPYNRQPNGREFSTGRMGDQLDQNQHLDEEDINGPQQEPTPQTSREPQHNGTFAVIPPNQTKREKLLTMASKEEEEYKRFLESRRSGPLNLTPQKLGGQASQAKARQQQQLTQSQSKYQKQFQRDEYRRRQKEEEDAKLQQMKDIQRKKAEKLEEKKWLEDRERKERWEKHMIKKNSEFLDQFSQPPKSSYSYNSYGQTQTAMEQDEDWIYQQALKESMETKREEDQRQKLENKQWQERSSINEEELDWVSPSPNWKEYTPSQNFYRQQLKEAEERRLRQMKEEHYRKKIKEEQWREEVEKTNVWQMKKLQETKPLPPSYKASKQSGSSYKQQLKEEEVRKLQEIKEEQLIKSELLEIKKEEEEKERRLSEREEQRRVNNAFLDKLQRLNTRQHEYSGESNTWA